jgi:hypothetical protein
MVFENLPVEMRDEESVKSEQGNEDSPGRMERNTQLL